MRTATARVLEIRMCPQDGRFYVEATLLIMGCLRVVRFFLADKSTLQERLLDQIDREHLAIYSKLLP